MRSATVPGPSRAVTSEPLIARRRRAGGTPSTCCRGSAPPPASSAATGAVRRRGQPLRHDPAAADARRPSAADDPARDPLHPRDDPPRQPRQHDPRAARPARSPSIRAGATSASTRASSSLACKQIQPLTPAGAIRCLLRPLRRAAGQAALGRQDAALHAGDAADRARPARGPLHPPDPRRARRRPHPARARDRRRGATISDAPNAGSAGSPRRASAPAESAGDYLEVRYEDLVGETEATLRQICDFIELHFDPAMLDYHRRAGHRLAEMNRDLDNGDNGPVRTADNRLAAHALTTEPPNTDRCGRWRRR